MYCVILGDIINSREIGSESREDVTIAAKETFNRINTEYINFLMADFGLVRGDAFEGVLLTPFYVPKIIQEIIKSFYKAEMTKVRISVVLGHLTATGNDRNEADGPAFYKASEDLVKMKEKKSKHWLQVSIDTNSIAQPIINSLLKLISTLSASWTKRQHEIVWAMEELSEQQIKVSEKFGITASVVNKQLKAANYEVYHQAWLDLEKYLANLEDTTVNEKSDLEKSYTAYYSIGQRCNIQQKYAEAYELLKKALELAKDELNENDPKFAVIYNGLAENLINTKKFEEAKDFITKSLYIQKTLPKARLEYANTLNIFGDLYFNLNEFLEAKRYYYQAKDTALNTVGELHPYIKICNKKLENVSLIIDNQR